MLLFVQLCIHVHMYTRYSHLKRKSLAIYDTAHSDCKRSLQSPSHLHTSHICLRHFSCRYFSTWLILNQIESLIRTSSTFTLSGQKRKPIAIDHLWFPSQLTTTSTPGASTLVFGVALLRQPSSSFSSFRESTITGYNTNVGYWERS